MKITDYNDLSILTDRFVPEKFHNTTFYELVKSFLGKDGVSKQHNTVNNWLNKIDPGTITTKSFDDIEIYEEKNYIEFNTNNKYTIIYLNGIVLSNNKYNIFKDGTYIEFTENLVPGDIVTIEYYSAEYLTFLNHYIPMLSDILETNIQLGGNSTYQILEAAYKIIDNKGKPKVYEFLSKLLLPSVENDPYHMTIDEFDSRSYSKREIKIAEQLNASERWRCGEGVRVHELFIVNSDYLSAPYYTLRTYWPITESLSPSLEIINFNTVTGQYEAPVILNEGIAYNDGTGSAYYEFDFLIALNYKDVIRISRNYLSTETVGDQVICAGSTAYEKGYQVCDINSSDDTASNIEEFTYRVTGTFDKNIFKKYLMPINHPLGWDVVIDLYSILELRDEHILGQETLLEWTVNDDMSDSLTYVDDDIILFSQITWGMDDYDGGAEQVGNTSTIYYVGGLNITNNRIPVVGDEYFYLSSNGVAVIPKPIYGDSLSII